MDHLDNVRFSSQQNPIIQQLERLQSDDYYPFGKPKSSGSPVSLTNKYLYNGKEIQDELNSNNEDGQYDYGARFYDPVIGRWISVDPLALRLLKLKTELMVIRELAKAIMWRKIVQLPGRVQ